MNRHDMPVPRVTTRCAFFLLAAALTSAACTLAELADQAKEYESSTVLVGRVEVGRERDGPIVVGAYARQGDGWHLAHQTLLHEHGGFELIVPRGDYTLFAFADRNGNGLFDADEPAARHAGNPGVHASGSGMVGGLDIESDDSETHRSHHLVVPGRAGVLAPIVLQPRR
jgi:hypothetical protein